MAVGARPHRSTGAMAAMLATRRMRPRKALPTTSFVRTMASAAQAPIRVKTYNAISPIGLQVYDSQYDISPVRSMFFSRGL